MKKEDNIIESLYDYIDSNGCLKYERYVEFIKNIINQTEKDIKKDKDKLSDLIGLIKLAELKYASLNDPEDVYVDNECADNFIEAVGLAYEINCKNKQLNAYKRELNYLNTPEGRDAYENHKGQYYNI